MYTHILVAMDGIDAPKRVLTEAIGMAKVMDAQLTVIYVVDKSATFTYARLCEPHQMIDAERAVGRAMLDDALATMKALGVSGDTEVFETQGIADEVADGIARYAELRGVDLMVMSSYGGRGIRHTVLDSVAARLTRYSWCPVLLIREMAAAPPEGLMPPGRGEYGLDVPVLSRTLDAGQPRVGTRAYIE